MADESKSKVAQFQVAETVLEDIVRGSLQESGLMDRQSGEARLRVNQIAVDASESNCNVLIEAAAIYGESLSALAEKIQPLVSDRLEGMTGMTVRAVDVTFTGVYPSASAE